jgi:hypothetical protein
MLKRFALAGIDALVIMLAALACLFCVWRIDPKPDAAVLAVVLCVSLGRSQIDRDLYGRIEAAFVLPAVALACAGIGWLFHIVPVVGALVYVLGMALSIWIRRFGERARRAGGLIALPFVTLLTVPVRPAPGGFTVSIGHASMHFPTFALPVLTGWLALFWVGLAHVVLKLMVRRQFQGDIAAKRRAAVPKPASAPAQGTEAAQPLDAKLPMSARASAMAPISTPASTASTQPISETPSTPAAVQLLPSTRMAVQMAVALIAAFTVGALAFREHWAWIVLTAMIVNLGNRGRLDVVYKGLHRLAGAAAGTVVAFAMGYVMSTALPVTSHSGVGATAALTALFLGIWLRPLGYAWWALCITVALALLQGLAPLDSLSLLATRLLAIAIGAVIGVASAWWVYPIDSISIVRRRLANALAHLSDAFDPDHRSRNGHTDTPPAAPFRTALAALTQVAPVFRAARKLSRWKATKAMAQESTRQPVRITGSMMSYLHALSLDADRIDTLLRCEIAACDLIERGVTPPAVRRAVGTARKTLREREPNLHALQALAEHLEQLRQEPL